MRLLLPLSLLLSISVACDGNDEPGDTIADAEVADTSEPEDSAADTEVPQPIDTALPDIEVTVGDNELRNGVTAWVGHVTDGDTLGVWVGSGPRKLHIVRMLGLAAPECEKASRQTPDGNRYSCSADQEYYGLASFNELKALLEDKTVKITCDVAPNAPCEYDPFDRRLAYLEVDGKDAATEMARRGAAFSYTVFQASKRGQICEAEYDARRAKRGMWALGSIADVLARMNSDTRGWYNNHHDNRCDAAMR
jgi:endonuclease YncB( thermonuclease family)